MQRINAVSAAQFLLRETLAQARCIVDATAGNGGDTLFLAQASPPEAVLYAFDTQAEALVAATKEKTRVYAAKIRYILAGHEDVAHYIAGEIDVAMFNLGYRPGGDHALTTRAATTARSLAAVTQRLRVGGQVAVVAYPGHAEGRAERDFLDGWLPALPKRQFTVWRCAMINHEQRAPVLYMVEKVRS